MRNFLASLSFILFFVSFVRADEDKAGPDDNKPPEGFKLLFNGKDLTGWQGLVELPERSKLSAEQLAETLGVEPTAVHRRLGLLRLPEDVAARVDAGEIQQTAAYEISKLQVADDQRAVAAQVAAGALDHAGTVAEVRRIKAARAGGKAKGRGAS